ncbi:protein-disulfide reductase DsbD family protein [Psychromonas ingrahamii]|uniref:protein-disulfide reductase DsbD family protein n=1 Tax=Psychromonas ingrahamii TaxID=357794 RepID=UPI00031936FF
MFIFQLMKVAVRLRLTILFVLSLLLSAFSVSAQPVSTGWLTHPDHPPVEVRFMLTGEVDKTTHKANGLLEVNLEGEWKTYWRSPGEGGIAPALDWSQSSNLSDLEWRWPTPTYYEQLGVMTLGYKHHVIFPMQLTLEDINQPIVFSGKLTLPTCTNICVLTDYELDLPAVTLADITTDATAQHLYQQGLSSVPTQSDSTEVVNASFDYDSQRLQVTLQQKKEWQDPQIIVDGDEVTDDYFSQPAININNNIVTATYKVTNWLGKTKLVGKPVSITVSDALFAHELSAVIDDKPLVKSSSTNLFTMIAFALLGGLILNIMPCVLPVLGMKLNSMLTSSHLSKRTIRLQFLASASGILTSFWLLALGLLILKLTGNAMGWGIQFQSPWFIGFMVTITALFTANLLGLFEVKLPGRLSTSIANKGGDSTSGHFVQGMFATLLATPCSAPFLGTAVAFALGASILEMWMVFTFLGLGMALPWLVFALFPNLISLMPKPGLWMNKMKAVFGLMMFVTTLWLLSLLVPFIGGLATVVIGLLFCAYLLYRIAKNHGKKTVIVILAVSLLFTSAGLFIANLTAQTFIKDDLTWLPLNENSIDQYVKQGNTVFVDITADWCITCKANKIGVILQDPVYSELKQERVITMQGDWTKPSDRITNYLKSYQRFGVPLNVVYGPNAPQGLPLSVILSSDEVMQALEDAGREQ